MPVDSVPKRRGRLVARGHQGQTILCIPDLRRVVTRRRDKPLAIVTESGKQDFILVFQQRPTPLSIRGGYQLRISHADEDRQLPIR